MLFPQFHIDEVKKQEARDLHALRPRLRSARSPAARVPASDLPDRRAPTWGTCRRASCHDRQLHGDLRRHPEPQAARGPAPAADAVPPATVQPDRGPAHRRGPAAAWPASTATRTDTRTLRTHLIGDIRPQEFRRRIDTPSLRGVNIQRLFGSQRALKTVEDFTEFEQRAAYFDGDPVIATKKGVNPLERGSQVHAMAEFQELLDFPPAPKLSVVDGKLDPALASPAGDARPGRLLRQGPVRDVPRAAVPPAAHGARTSIGSLRCRLAWCSTSC